MYQTPYNSIGVNYNRTRVADPRITSTILRLFSLPSESIIADIGAGTGNYSLALASLGYQVLAVEPSEEMQKQALPHKNISWLYGFAESIPFPDNSVNGAIIILALHHFTSMVRAVQELTRICPSGPIVVFTMDPRESEEFWFNTYFTEIYQHVMRTFPPLSEIINLFERYSRRSATITKFPLPGDLVDRNMCSGWNRPEMYLDPQMRRNTSGFAMASPDVVQRGLTRLQIDLKIGEWDKKYGVLRERASFDAGFRFIKFNTI